MSAAAFPQEKHLRFPGPTPAENERRLNEFSSSLSSYDDFSRQKQRNFFAENRKDLSRHKNGGKLFASGKLCSLFSRIFIVDEAKKASVLYCLGEIYFEQKMSGAPFYKKPAQAKQNFEWPPKRVVAPVKVSRQEPAEVQERIDDNRKFTSNLRRIFNR